MHRGNSFTVFSCPIIADNPEGYKGDFSDPAACVVSFDWTGKLWYSVEREA
jgi:hypothetical protein